METKKFTIMSICYILIIIVGIGLGLTYYNDYIKPESYVNGEVTREPYESTKLLDYISTDDILFSAELNKSVFSTVDSTSTCEYTFEHIDFNGENNTYGLYVNDYLLNNLTTDAGTISGEYEYRYYDPTKNVVCDSTMTISFSFYTLKTVCHLELDLTELPYLMKFLSQNQFVVSIVKSDNRFISEDKVVEQTSTVTINIGETTRTFTQIAGSHLDCSDFAEKYTSISSLSLISGDCIIDGNILTFGYENSVVEGVLDSIDFDLTFTGLYVGESSKSFRIAGDLRCGDYSGHVSSAGVILIQTVAQPVPFNYIIDVGSGTYTVESAMNVPSPYIIVRYTNATKLSIEIISRLEEVLN